jgi:hypothetical protein
MEAASRVPLGFTASCTGIARGSAAAVLGMVVTSIPCRGSFPSRPVVGGRAPTITWVHTGDRDGDDAHDDHLAISKVPNTAGVCHRVTTTVADRSMITAAFRATR